MPMFIDEKDLESMTKQDWQVYHAKIKMMDSGARGALTLIACLVLTSVLMSPFMVAYPDAMWWRVPIMAVCAFGLVCCVWWGWKFFTIKPAASNRKISN